MGKPKRAPLYEVLCKSKNPPSWVADRRQADAEPPADGEQPADARPAEPVAPRPKPVVVVTPEPDDTAPEPDLDSAGADGGRPPGEKILTIDGSVIRVVLTSSAAAVAIFTLAALIVVAFWSGRSTGYDAGLGAGYERALQDIEEEGADAIERARLGAPQGGLFDGIGESPIAADPGEPDPGPTLAARSETESVSTGARDTTWTPGYTYIVVQDFADTARQDAIRAQAYLREHGIETSLEDAPGSWIRLITCKGFNRDDPVQKKEADQYLTRLRGIGAAYFKGGGQYKLEGYFNKLTQDHW